MNILLTFKKLLLTVLQSLERIGTKIGTIVGRLIKVKDFVFIRTITDVFAGNISMIGSITAHTRKGDLASG